MAFDVSADAYDRFMGRFSRPLAPLFADFAGIESGMRVLDVGSGAAALTTELVSRLGAERVAAAEPSRRFVEEVSARLPHVDVRGAHAESLPWPDESFDAVVAQLVVTFMSDAPAGVAEMRRVVRPGGVVALCMWDLDRMEMLRAIAVAGRKLDPGAAPGRDRLRWRTEPELRELLEGTGLRDVETAELSVASEYGGFEELWEALLGGAGPASEYVLSLDEPRRVALREQLHREVGAPAGAFTLHATAWAARGRADR